MQRTLTEACDTENPFSAKKRGIQTTQECNGDGPSIEGAAKISKCSFRERLEKFEQHFWVQSPLVGDVGDACDTATDDGSLGIVSQFCAPSSNASRAGRSTEISRGSWLKVDILIDSSLCPLERVGSRLWAASCILTQLLLRPAPLGSEWCSRLGQSCAPMRVLELGAGTAVPCVALAASLGHSVVATDLPEITPLTRANAEVNRHLCREEVVVRDLTWGDESAARSLGPIDLVLGADLCYDPSSYDPLLRTLRALAPKWVLLAVVLRPEDLGEETFENYCSDEGVHLSLRYTALLGAGAHRVNVYEIEASSLHV